MAASDVFDTIVVGAGLSGLSAARKLVSEGKSVLVLEAKERVGGRTLTVEEDGLKWDLGGQWVGPTQPHILALLKEFGIETYKQYIDGKKVLQLKNGETKVYSDTAFGQLPLTVFELLDLVKNIGRIELVSRRLSAVNPAVAGSEYDQHTLGSLAQSWSSYQRVRDVLTVLPRVCLGTESSLVSALYFLAYCTGTGGLAPLCEAKDGGGQEMRIVGGAQQVSERLALILGPKRIVFGSPVVAITQNDELVSVETQGGHTFSARTVICATPPHLTAGIAFTPSLHPLKKFLYGNMPIGHMVKVILVYRTAWWRTKGLSGEAISSCGPLCYVVDACHTGGQPALLAFVAGSDAIGWGEQPEQVRRDRVLTQMESLFGTDARSELVTIKEKDWAQEPWNGGCPVCVPPPGVLTIAASQLRTPHGRVLFAGTELGTVWYGFLNGAVQSGMRAADEALTLLSGGVIQQEVCPPPPPPLVPASAMVFVALGIAAIVAYKYWRRL